MSKVTARAVIFHPDGRLLMVERHKGGEHYFVLPGGHTELGETPEQAVVRETFEETSLPVTVNKLLYTSVDAYGNDQRIFLCEYQGDSEPTLQPRSIESRLKEAGEPQQWAPAWFSFEQLKGKTVYPKDLLRYIEEDQAINYHHNPYKIIERPV